MRRAASFTFALAVLLTASFPVVAHEGRMVGAYTVAVGWRDEPALAGLLNAVEIEVRENASGRGVEELSKTLTLSIRFGGGNAAFVPEQSGELRRVTARQAQRRAVDRVRPVLDRDRRVSG